MQLQQCCHVRRGHSQWLQKQDQRPGASTYMIRENEECEQTKKLTMRGVQMANNKILQISFCDTWGENGVLDGLRDTNLRSLIKTGCTENLRAANKTFCYTWYTLNKTSYHCDFGVGVESAASGRRMLLRSRVRNMVVHFILAVNLFPAWLSSDGVWENVWCSPDERFHIRSKT